MLPTSLRARGWVSADNTQAPLLGGIGRPKDAKIAVTQNGRACQQMSDCLFCQFLFADGGGAIHRPPVGTSGHTGVGIVDYHDAQHRPVALAMLILSRWITLYQFAAMLQLYAGAIQQKHIVLPRRSD